MTGEPCADPSAFGSSGRMLVPVIDCSSRKQCSNGRGQVHKGFPDGLTVQMPSVANIKIDFFMIQVRAIFGERILIAHGDVLFSVSLGGRKITIHLNRLSEYRVF